MPDLIFAVESVEPVAHAAEPLLHFKLRIAQVDIEPKKLIQNIALRCQIRIEPARRHYSAERQKLHDLFGEPARWGQTLKPMLWTHTGVTVPPFTGSTLVDLPVHCTYDFNVAATKYFYGLDEGEIPLCLLFSGTIFYAGETGVQVGQIPWDKEANFRLPVRVWKDMMELYYPNSAWLRLRRDVFDRLYEFKSRNNLPTWEQALEHLLASAHEEART